MNSYSRFGRYLAAGVATVVLLGCGDPFESSGVVVAVEGPEVCVTRSGDRGEPWKCFYRSGAGGGQTFAVGDCVDLSFSGEGAVIREAVKTTCASDSKVDVTQPQ
jgi:hypothetical protein